VSSKRQKAVLKKEVIQTLRPYPGDDLTADSGGQTAYRGRASASSLCKKFLINAMEKLTFQQADDGA